MEDNETLFCKKKSGHEKTVFPEAPTVRILLHYSSKFAKNFILFNYINFLLVIS